MPPWTGPNKSLFLATCKRHERFRQSLRGPMAARLPARPEGAARAFAKRMGPMSFARFGNAPGTA